MQTEREREKDEEREEDIIQPNKDDIFFYQLVKASAQMTLVWLCVTLFTTKLQKRSHLLIPFETYNLKRGEMDFIAIVWGITFFLSFFPSFLHSFWLTVDRFAWTGTQTNQIRKWTEVSKRTSYGSAMGPLLNRVLWPHLGLIQLRMRHVTMFPPSPRLLCSHLLLLPPQHTYVTCVTEEQFSLPVRLPDTSQAQIRSVPWPSPEL